MNGSNSKVIALIGGVLLAIGVFLPLVRVPKLGTINYINNGSGDGLIVLILAGVAIALALLERTKHAIWPGIASAAMIAFTFMRLQSRLAEVRERAERELEGNPFSGIAEAAAGAIQLEYGWAVLTFGALMVIAGGALAWRRNGAADVPGER
jgi:hypothetical protein